MTTISLPAFSGRLASSSAAEVAAPDEMPTSRPSSRRHAAGDGEGVVVRDADHLVVGRRIEHGGNETGADSLDRVRPFLAAGQHRRGIRLDRDDLDAGFPCLEHFADPGHRAAGTDAGHEDIDLAVGIVPDLFGRRVAVDRRIGRIFELLRNEVARIGRRQFPRLVDRAGHAVRPRRQDQFGAVGLEQQLALAAHRFRHDEGALDAACRADHGEADAGIARGRLQHDGIGADACRPPVPHRAWQPRCGP